MMDFPCPPMGQTLATSHLPLSVFLRAVISLSLASVIQAQVLLQLCLYSRHLMPPVLKLLDLPEEPLSV